MAAANGRLRKELNEVGKVDKSSGVSAAAAGDGSDLRHLKGKINGPESTCYEGGIFEIDIQIPKQYPFEPPKVGNKLTLSISLWCLYKKTYDRLLKTLLTLFSGSNLVVSLDEVYHKDMASKYQFTNRSNLSCKCDEFHFPYEHLHFCLCLSKNLIHKSRNSSHF